MKKLNTRTVFLLSGLCLLVSFLDLDTANAVSYPGDCTWYRINNIRTYIEDLAKEGTAVSSTGVIYSFGDYLTDVSVYKVFAEVWYYDQGAWYRTYTNQDLVTVNIDYFDGPEYPYTDFPGGCADLPEQCEEEQNQAITECGAENWEWTDESNCEYKCIVPPVCGDEDIASAILECGEENYEMIEIAGPDPEHAECGWTCNNRDCSDEYQIFRDACAYGVSTFDWDTCAGTCKKCYPDARADVEDICRGRGGVYYFKCTIDDPDDYVDIKYRCAYDEGEVPEDYLDETIIEPPEDTDDGTPPPDPDPSNPPADPNDPDNQPAADPVDEPDATEPEKTNNRLDAIKENEGTQVDQNNAQIGQLNTIADNSQVTANNTQAIANNQGLIQDEIKHSSEVDREGYDRLGAIISNEGINDRRAQVVAQQNINGAIHNARDSIVSAIENQENDFSPLETSESLPTLNGTEFESDLPTEHDYTEFDDFGTLASDQAIAYAEEHLVIDTSNSIVNAQITTSGEACLSGNVSLHSHTIPVSICFNKPWMLQGYAIMRMVFIAVAYLQTAILLNKAFH